MTATLIPDVEKLLGDYLRDHPTIVALGARVAGTVPSNTRSPWVKVTQIDGTPSPGHRGDHLIDYLVQFDCYAGATATESHNGQAEASTLARTVRAALNGLDSGAVLDTAAVSGVTFTSMSRLPDTAFEPVRERYVLDAQVWAHA